MGNKGNEKKKPSDKKKNLLWNAGPLSNNEGGEERRGRAYLEKGPKKREKSLLYNVWWGVRQSNTFLHDKANFIFTALLKKGRGGKGR